MENSGKMRSLEDSCFLMIAQNPDLSLKAERVRSRPPNLCNKLAYSST